MSSRTSSSKKNDGDEESQIPSVVSSSTRTGSGGGSISKRTMMARMLLLLVSCASLVSLAFITQYDSATGSWKVPLPEVSFSINDLISWADARVSGIFSNSGTAPLATAQDQGEGEEVVAVAVQDGENKSSGNANDGSSVATASSGSVVTDDDVIPLHTTGGAGGITAEKFKELMRQATINGKSTGPATRTATDTATETATKVGGNSGAAAGGAYVKFSEADVRAEALDLLSKVKETLEWAVSRTASAGGYKKPTSPISWTKLSVAETHILVKVRRYLEYITDTSKVNKTEFQRLVTEGHTCSSVQKQQQQQIMQEISMDICSEIEWYKLAQLTKPSARTVIDVGGNKGYLASLFLSLWGGGGYGVSPSYVYTTAQATSMWEGSRNPAGYCRDGFNEGYPLYCPSAYRENSGKCTVRNEGFTVRSFDGSSYLAGAINDMLNKTTDVQVKAGTVWMYHHRAVSDTEGTARFTKQSKDIKVQQGPGFEGGKLRPDSASEVDTEVVQLITVDRFLAKEAENAGGMRYPARGTTIGKDKRDVMQYHIDIMKVDAEGNDNKVLNGAKLAIENTISLFTFEGGSGVAFGKEDIQELDSQHGYSCYSTSRAGLFKWNGGCMDEKYMGGFRSKDKGNVFCTNRRRSPLMSVVFDAMSFPMMWEHEIRMAERKKTSASAATSGFNRDTLISTELATVYVNVKPFCDPYPACILTP